jgi:hypothetical protein
LNLGGDGSVEERPASTPARRERTRDSHRESCPGATPRKHPARRAGSVPRRPGRPAA